MADLTLEVREAVVSWLRADVALTALVPAERVFGLRQPVDAPYPFVRYGTPDTLPNTASCMSGSVVYVDLSTFAGKQGASEDEACTIAAAVVASLDGARLDLEGGRYAEVRWTGGQTLPDPDERDVWHALRSFEIEAVA